jgi:hypothetical protein
MGLPDGTSVRSDAPGVDATLPVFFGRPVTLQRAAPDDFTIDQFHPDIEDLDPEGHRDTVTESKLGSAFFAEAGLPSAVPVGAFFDLSPVSVLTTSTLDRLDVAGGLYPCAGVYAMVESAGTIRQADVVSLT